MVRILLGSEPRLFLVMSHDSIRGRFRPLVGRSVTLSSEGRDKTASGYCRMYTTCRPWTALWRPQFCIYNRGFYTNILFRSICNVEVPGKNVVVTEERIGKNVPGKMVEVSEKNVQVPGENLEVLVKNVEVPGKNIEALGKMWK